MTLLLPFEKPIVLNFPQDRYQFDSYMNWFAFVVDYAAPANDDPNAEQLADMLLEPTDGVTISASIDEDTESITYAFHMDDRRYYFHFQYPLFVDAIDK
jgi:hypothetical protein